MKIATRDQWVQQKLIEYDADGVVPIKYDLCAAIGTSFLDLIKRTPLRSLEDAVTTPDDDLQNVYNVFVDAYEEVHGVITNKDKTVRSQFAQVKIGILNDSNEHEELMQKLHKVVEYLQ